MILSIDPSLTATGIAVIKDNKVIKTTTIRTSSKDDTVVRIKKIMTALSNIVADSQKEGGEEIAKVIIESPPLIRFQYPNSMRQLCIAYGAILGFLVDVGYEVIPVAPPCGRRAKGWVKIARKRLEMQGIKTKTDHEAVAITYGLHHGKEQKL